MASGKAPAAGAARLKGDVDLKRSDRSTPNGGSLSGIGTDTTAGRAMRLVRALDPLPEAVRWLALDERDQTNHVLYEFTADGDAESTLKELDARAGISCLHVLPIEAAWRCEDRSAVWASSPFIGNQQGLVRLGDVVRARGGRLPGPELCRAHTQVLRALASLHEAGIAAGGLDRDRLLVDARGAVKLELHAFGASAGESALADRAADDVASAFALAYELATGCAAVDGRAPISRVAVGFNPMWDAVFDRGLDPLGGFGSAVEALEAVNDTDAGSIAGDVRTAGPAGVVVRRFRRAVSASGRERSGGRGSSMG